MTKLLFFASDFKIGLSALLTDELIALHRYGIAVDAIAGTNEQEPGLGEKVGAEKICCIRVEGLDDHRNFKLLAGRIRQIVTEREISVVHVQNNWQLALVSYVKYALGRRNIRIIYTLHGFRHNSRLKSVVAQAVIGSALLLFADKIICMSTYLKNKFRLLSYKITLLPLGVPDTFFEAQAPALPANGLQMIFPAQFRQGKNQDILIKAFAAHLKETGDACSHLTLPGTGEILESMRQLARELGIADRVTFPGQCTKEQIREAYARCNIGLVSSNSETFGQSIIEPFVLGRCIVTTRVGIAPDIITEGENGFYFKTHDQLQALFTMLYRSPETIAAAGARNFSKRDLFNWNAICSHYAKALLNA